MGHLIAPSQTFTACFISPFNMGLDCKTQNHENIKQKSYTY